MLLVFVQEFLYFFASSLLQSNLKTGSFTLHRNGVRITGALTAKHRMNKTTRRMQIQEREGIEANGAEILRRSLDSVKTGSKARKRRCLPRGNRMSAAGYSSAAIMLGIEGIRTRCA